MSTVAPPIAPATPATAPGVVPQPTVVVPEAPPSLVQLATGTRLDAVVVGIESQGVYQLQTAHGTLSIQTAYPLPRDAVLVLLLQALNPQTRLLITSVNGMVPALAARGAGEGAPLPGPATASATSPAPAGAVAPVNLTVGTTVTATLLRPPTSTLNLPGVSAPGFTAPAGFTAGTPAPGFQMPAVGNPGTGGAIGLPSAALATLAQATTAATGPVPGGLVALQTGLQVPVAILSLEPGVASTIPGAPPMPPATGTLATGQVLHGTVTGTTPLGHPLVQTAEGLFSLATRTLPPAGSTITLKVTGTPSMASTGRETLAPLPHAELLNARDWPLLDEALRALGEVNPAMAQKVVETALPRADARLGAGILFFLAALRGGDLRTWLGIEPVRILQRFRPDLMARLRDDFGRMARLAEEPLSGDWRVTLVPFHADGEIERLRLFMRNNGGEDEDEARGNGGLRFVVDVALSRIGRLQLDGLVRAKGKRLDLIVRTQSYMPASMQNDIRRIFEEANDLTGVTGGLSFQAAPPDFVDVTGAPTDTIRPSLMV